MDLEEAEVEEKVDLLFTSKIGEISFYMLKDNFVDIYRVKGDLSVREVIEKYHNKQLEPLAAPTHPVEESKTGTS